MIVYDDIVEKAPTVERNFEDFAMLRTLKNNNGNRAVDEKLIRIGEKMLTHFTHQPCIFPCKLESDDPGLLFQWSIGSRCYQAEILEDQIRIFECDIEAYPIGTHKLKDRLDTMELDVGKLNLDVCRFYENINFNRERNEKP